MRPGADERQSAPSGPVDEAGRAARSELVRATSVDARPDLGGHPSAGERMGRAEVDLGLEPSAAVLGREVGVRGTGPRQEPRVPSRRGRSGAPAADVDDAVRRVEVVALCVELAAGGVRIGAADEAEPDADVRRVDRDWDPVWCRPELVVAAGAVPLQLHRPEGCSRRLVDERRKDVCEAKVGHGDGQHALLHLDHFQLHTCVRVDRGHFGKAWNLEDERQPGFAPLDVEHQARRVARRLRLRVVAPDGAGGVRPALVEERDCALVRAADLVVVAGATGPAESRRFVLDRRVRACRVGKAPAEQRTARQGRCVDLQLQVPLVDPPVADVDGQRQEEQEDGYHHRCEHDDAAVFARGEIDDSPRGAHVQPPLPA